MACFSKVTTHALRVMAGLARSDEKPKDEVVYHDRPQMKDLLVDWRLSP